MKQLKKTPRLQLEKFSTIFMQLGLVLVMFVVFISLEHETEQTAFVLETKSKDDTPVYIIDKPIIFEKEVIKKSKPKQTQKRIIKKVFKHEKVKNDHVIKNIIEKKTEKSQDFDLNKVIEAKVEDPIDDKDDPKPIGIKYVSKIPVFAGCEKSSEKSQKEGRKCFDKKMSKLINRHFNAGLGQTLGLKNGKHKILTQFVIDKAGNVVDIKIRAPHATLKNEVNRVVNKIPKFTPGEKDGEKVKVSYMLPITFQVE